MLFGIGSSWGGMCFRNIAWNYSLLTLVGYAADGLDADSLRENQILKLNSAKSYSIEITYSNVTIIFLTYKIQSFFPKWAFSWKPLTNVYKLGSI